jgi:undecaprenyl-diphosphatase
MSPVIAALLGAVEGITEFLPISSTGHLILVSALFNLAKTDFLKSFEIIIQLGAITAVIVLYWRSFLKPDVLKRLVVAFIPTGVIGLTLYHFIKTYLLNNNAVVLWAMLLGGIALIVFEYFHHEPIDATVDIADITYTQSALIGVAQALAIIPGLSRSASTIVGGLLLGLKRQTIVTFSFLLAVPTMLAASILDLSKSAGAFSGGDVLALIIGFVVAFVVALGAIRLLLRYVRTHNFVPFGLYRILAAIIFWFIIF